MGWAIFLALAAAVLAALWYAGRASAGAVQLVGAALLVAAAGYAWQGRPGLVGRPTAAADAPRVRDDPFGDERGAWLEQVGPDAQLLDAADALIRSGDADYAAAILRAGVHARPRSAVLWLGLGNALTQYAGGAVTPAARFAFDRGSALAPAHPAPRYFLGLALALSGDLAAAAGIWRELLRTAPVDASWRKPVRNKLMLLERLSFGR